MSDLLRAQEFFSKMQPLHDQIVDSLRRSGWSREDAVFEADERISRMLGEEERNGAKT